MELTRSALVSFLLLFSMSVLAKHPVFTACIEKTDSLQEYCSKKTYQNFLEKGEQLIGKSLGVFVVDSVSITYKIRHNGSIKIKSINSRVSELLFDKCSSWLEQLEGQVEPGGHQEIYRATLHFELPRIHAVDIQKVDLSPTLKSCVDSNADGQRQCLDYLLSEMLKSFKLRSYQGFAKFDIYFSPRGKIMGLEFKAPARNKKINDSLIDRFSSLNKYLTINEKASRQYYSRFYKLTYSYNYFFSPLTERTYFERESERKLKSHDTLGMLEHLIEAGLTLGEYSDFIEYCNIFIGKYNITGSESVETCKGEVRIDSLISRSVEIDEQTDSIVRKEGFGSISKECGDEPGISIRNVDYRKEFSPETRKDQHEFSLDRRLFRAIAPLCPSTLSNLITFCTSYRCTDSQRISPGLGNRSTIFLASPHKL